MYKNYQETYDLFQGFSAEQLRKIGELIVPMAVIYLADNGDGDIVTADLIYDGLGIGGITAEHTGTGVFDVNFNNSIPTFITQPNTFINSPDVPLGLMLVEIAGSSAITISTSNMANPSVIVAADGCMESGVLITLYGR